MAFAVTGVITEPPKLDAPKAAPSVSAGDKLSHLHNQAELIKSKNVLKLAVPVPKKKASEAPPPPPQDPTQWKMLGIALGKAPTVVLFVDGDIKNVVQGDALHNWTLSEVYPRKAVWKSGPHIREVDMFKQEKKVNLAQGTRNSLTISKEEAKPLLKDPNKMLQQALFTPFKKGNEIVGFKLSNIRSNSIFKKLGIQNGDVLRRINGAELTSPTKILQVYPSLAKAAAINLEVERGGNLMTLVLEIE